MSSFVITVKAEPEEAAVRGNALASGNFLIDRAAEDSILAELEAGNLWAWCTITVTVSCAGVSYSDYLGCCSYKDEADFRKGGYFDDMVSDCKTELIASAKAVLAAASAEEEERAISHGRTTPKADPT